MDIGSIVIGEKVFTPNEPNQVIVTNIPTGWQCPVCGVGVRHDVTVCPECKKRERSKTKTEIKE